MRHAAMIVAALVIAGCPRGGGDTTPARVLTPTQVVAGARATIEQWRQAYEVKSYEALAKLYAQNLDLVVVDGGIPIFGWPSVDAMLKDRLGRYKEVHVRLKDIQVQSLGPHAATATAAMTRELGDGTTTVTESGALTVVLRKADDAWLIVTEHYSYKRGN
jgi:uncharacterized protein (TIGR02246 family)